MKKQTITVVGIGYVGLSNAILLAQYNKVYAVDVLPEKVDMINQQRSPIKDKEIISYLSHSQLDLVALTNGERAYKESDYVIISTPTSYDSKNNNLDTSSIESVIQAIICCNPNAIIVIKSTIPIGYTQSVREKYGYNKIIFCPEFLREGKALYDNLYPSRIIVGTDMESPYLIEIAHTFSSLLQQGAEKKDIDILITRYNEAEAIKLFANTYLAMRISFFNELDTYAEMKELNSFDIIKGICLDSRIGDYYNNPSFGYGGYCLPKDTKQLLNNYKDIPENLIEAIVNSNSTRMDFIANSVYQKACIKKNTNNDVITIGVYHIGMKSNSDNFRQSSTLGIIGRLIEKGVKIIVYEPDIKYSDSLANCDIINNLEKFKCMSDLIIANRYNAALNDVSDKLYTRDIFYRD